MIFTCNVCGHPGNELLAIHYENPELPSCSACSSNVRFRWLVNKLSWELFGRAIPLTEFPFDSSIRGLGLTDPASIAGPFARHFTYRNTYLDMEPRLDIRNAASPIGEVDFLIASEVLEHVEPPVADAFHNIATLLKPDGLLLLTTPWVWDGDAEDALPELFDWKLDREDGRWVIVNRREDGGVDRFYDVRFDGSSGPSLGRTREHFPNLHDWRLSDTEGTWHLFNRRRDGELEVFRNLVFHGGPGLALEMRLFTRMELEGMLRAAGFCSVEFDKREWHEWGILFPYPWSYPITARKKATPFNPAFSGDIQLATGIRNRLLLGYWSLRKLADS